MRFSLGKRATATIAGGVSALGLVAVLTTPAPAVAQSSAAKAAATCSAVAQTPWYNSSTGKVYAKGYLSCSGAVNELSIRVGITRDGSSAGFTQQSLLAGSYLEDIASANNQAGDQTWCTTVQAAWGQSNDRHYGNDTTCESSGWLVE